MPLYNYTARDKLGKRATGLLFAASENDLTEKLAYLDYILISAKAEVTPKGRRGIKLKSTKVLDFTINLSALLKGGLPLLQSLRTLIRDSTDEEVSSVVVNLKDFVESGGSFKDALGFYPRTFSPMYKATVASGEKTGQLPLVLEELSNYLEWQLDLRAKVREAATYPIVVFVVMILVVSLLVGWVLPKFAPILKDLGADLPTPTKVILMVSDLFANFWYLFFGAIALTVFLVIFLSKNPKVSFFFDYVKLRFPIVGNLIYKLCVSRFSRSTYLCLSCGIPLIETLELGEEIIGNKILSSAVSESKKVVVAGGALSLGFSLTKSFPSFLVRMVEVGETSGSLPEGFRKAYEFYDKQIPRIIQRIFTILEPLMIVLMGVIVGGIAIAVFLPLIKVAQMIGD